MSTLKGLFYSKEIDGFAKICAHFNSFLANPPSMTANIATNNKEGITLVLTKLDATNQILEFSGNFKSELIEKFKAQPNLTFSYVLGEIKHSFSSHIIEMSHTHLKCHLPKLIRTITKRDFHRVEIPMGTPMTVSFIDPLNTSQISTHPMFDISIGGLSFIFLAEEQKKFVKEMVLSQVTLSLPSGLTITSNAEIRYIGDEFALPDGTRFLKCGIQFIYLDAGMEADLGDYLMQLYKETKKTAA